MRLALAISVIRHEEGRAAFLTAFLHVAIVVGGVIWQAEEAARTPRFIKLGKSW